MYRAAQFRLLAVAAAVGALAISSASFAGPRWIKVNGDGTTTDITQNTTSKKTTTTSPTPTTTTDPTTMTGTTTTTDPVTTATGTDAVTADYLPTIDPIYTPGEMNWVGRTYRVNAAATDYPNLPHSLKRGVNWSRLRFEVRPTDPSMESKLEKRRSELSGSVYGDPTRLPNGVTLWGAFSVNQLPWGDPVGMKSTYGGVYGQIHMGSKVGGSPALAFRRHQNGNFRITTRGEFNDAGTTRYDAALSWGVVHDVVYAVVLHPTAGKLRVWVDGRKLVDVSNVSIGHTMADSYWNFGLYFPGGVTGSVAAEYAHHVYPAKADLSGRVTSAPAWPAD